MLLHYLEKHENNNHTSSLNCCITALPEFNQSLFDFFNINDLQFILKLLYNL